VGILQRDSILDKKKNSFDYKEAFFGDVSTFKFN